MISFATYGLLSVVLWRTLRKRPSIPVRVKLAHAGAALLLASLVIPAANHFWWGIRHPAGAIEKYGHAIIFLPAWWIWLSWAFYVAVGLRFLFLCFGLAGAQAAARKWYSHAWPVLLVACVMKFPLGATTRKQVPPEIFCFVVVTGVIFFASLLWLIKRYYDTNEAQEVFSSHNNPTIANCSSASG